MFITHPKENRQHYSSCGAWAATTYYHQEAPELVVSMQQFFPKEPSDGSPRVLLLHQGFSYQNLWHKHARLCQTRFKTYQELKYLQQQRKSWLLDGFYYLPS
jgi:hypothetical protein